MNKILSGIVYLLTTGLILSPKKLEAGLYSFLEVIKKNATDSATDFHVKREDYPSARLLF